MNNTVTRQEFQTILASNDLNAKVFYAGAENDFSDNIIVYYRLAPTGSIPYADGRVHMRKFTVQVTHFHKKKLDSIEDLMYEHFGILPIQYDLVQPDTDYLATYYRFEVLTSGKW